MKKRLFISFIFLLVISGLVSATSSFDFQNDGDTSIEVTANLKDGLVSFNILFGENGQFTGLGKSSEERFASPEADELIYYEKKSGEDYHKWFVATYDVGKKESYILRAQVSRDTGSSRNEVTIQKLVDKSWVDACTKKIVGDICSIGKVTFTIDQITYVLGGDESVKLSPGNFVIFYTIIDVNGYFMLLPGEEEFPTSEVTILIQDSETYTATTWNAYWEGTEAKMEERIEEISSHGFCGDGICGEGVEKKIEKYDTSKLIINNKRIRISINHFTSGAGVSLKVNDAILPNLLIEGQSTTIYEEKLYIKDIQEDMGTSHPPGYVIFVLGKESPESCPVDCKDAEVIILKDEPTEISEDTTNYVCEGCEFDNQCVPYGFRVKNESKRLYCEMDAELKEQKTVDSEGNWAECQNNYECRSNICSDDECIEVQKMLDDASRFKSLGIRVLCRLAHLFNEDSRNICVYNFLEE